MFTNGSRFDSGAAGYAVHGKTANPGWESRTTWIQPRSVRCRMCSTGESTGGGGETPDGAGAGDHFHRCPGWIRRMVSEDLGQR